MIAPGSLTYGEPFYFAGITYTGLSRFQLHAIHAGRYFIVHGEPRGGYTLLERSPEAGPRDGAAWPRHVEIDSEDTIGRKFERLLDLADVSAEIQRLADSGEALPADTRHPRVINAARHRAAEAALDAQRLDRTEVVA